MQKTTTQALLAFLLMATLISFSTMIILDQRFGLDRQNLIVKLSTLTDANALEWAATPGERNVPLRNTFKLFDHIEGPYFRLAPGELNYSYQSEFVNRTYIQSSPGYIKFLPTFWFEETHNPAQEPNITRNINLVAAQNFYRSLSQPVFTKLPRYLNTIIDSLQSDFLIYYFTKTIFEFYTKDFQAVQQTIFSPAKIETAKQQLLWEDQQYGWSTESTFKAWIIAFFEKSPEKLKDYFQLTDSQIEALLGTNSIIAKMRKLIVSAITDGIKKDASTGGKCKQDPCSMAELAAAQWANGTLTRNQFVPPVNIAVQSYANFNDSIPENYEYFINFEPIQISEASMLFNDDFEAIGLTNFNTIQYIFDNINDGTERGVNRTQKKLGLSTSLTASNVQKYLEMQQKFIDTESDTWAYQSWRSMSLMIDEASKMLRNGLHAKTLTFATKECNIPFDKACGSAYDYSLNSQNALIWVDAFFQGTDSASFKKLVDFFKKPEEEISAYIESNIQPTIQEHEAKFAEFYKCQYEVCSEQELFYRQWRTSEITMNLPTGMGFFPEDIVPTLSSWDIYKGRPFVMFELNQFVKHQIDSTTTLQLLNFGMGGIYGYFSLRNLYDHILTGTQLDSRFPTKAIKAEQLFEYLKHCLTNYWYGGHLIEADAHNYLFDYGNKYTQQKQTWDPLNEGVSWRSSNAQIIRANSDEVMRFATTDDYFQLDTGIKEITGVGRMITVFNSKVMTAKKVVYYNPESSYQTSYYYQVSQDEVQGSYGFAFQPDSSENTLKLFDIDLFTIYDLKFKRESVHHGFDVRQFGIEDQLLDLSSVEGYPLKVSIGKPKIDPCAVIDGKTCEQFLGNYTNNYYKIEPLTGITVELKKTLIYWLEIDSHSPLLQGPLSNPVMVPILIRTIEYSFNEDQMNEYFSEVSALERSKKAGFITTLVLGIVFGLLFFGMLYYYIRIKRSERILSGYPLGDPPLSVYSSYAQ